MERRQKQGVRAFMGAALLILLLFPCYACALIPRTITERYGTAAYASLVVLAQSRELAMDFYERYCGDYRYRRAQLSTYERGTSELLASPTGSFVMLYDRSRPAYPSHYLDTFGWLSLPNLEPGYYGTRSRDRVVLLIVADSPEGLTALVRSMPKELLEP